LCIGLAHDAIANGPGLRTRRIERAGCAGCACIKCRHDPIVFDRGIREKLHGARVGSPQA